MKSLSFRDSPGLSRFIPAYPVQYPFVTCILPFYRRHAGGNLSKYNVRTHWRWAGRNSFQRAKK